MFVIKAIQDARMQILPDKLFDYKKKKYVRSFECLPYNEKRSVVESLTQKHMYGHNRNQRPSGAVFSGDYIFKSAAGSRPLYIVHFDADILISNQMGYDTRCNKVDLKVRYMQECSTTIKKFHASARRFGCTWEEEIQSTCRRKTVQGRMKSFGAVPGSGQIKVLERMATRTNKNNCNLHHRQLNILAKKIALHHFPDVVKDIENVMNFFNVHTPDSIGGSDGLSCQMIQSQHRLVTEPHVDQDLSRCLSIWTVEKGSNNNIEGMYFVLPYLRCQVGGISYYGVAVRIEHGVGIEWDGRSIFHCSSLPGGDRANVYGTFFGITEV